MPTFLRRFLLPAVVALTTAACASSPPGARGGRVVGGVLPGDAGGGRGTVRAAPRARAGTAGSAAGDPARGGEGVSVRGRERYYPVDGTSASGLDLALATRGPRRRGARWHAVTDYAVRWSFEPEPSGRGCVAARVRIVVDLVTTLPRWRERAEAPALLVAEWDHYLERLRRHEEEHAAIVVRSGRRLHGLLDGMAAASCRDLRRRARGAAEALAREAEVANARWDRATAHGARSGT